MNILIVGCGRVGSRLIQVLDEMGHDISVLEEVDANKEHLQALEDSNFSGMIQLGSPIDVDMLRQAGIENCEALVAVCPEDNINIMVCQIATEMFHVPCVLARITDPARKKVFTQRFGMHAVCSTNLTLEAILHGISNGPDTRRLTFGSSTVSFLPSEPDVSLLHQPLSEVVAPKGQVVLGVLRATGIMELNTIPSPIIHRGDKIIFASIAD